MRVDDAPRAVQEAIDHAADLALEGLFGEIGGAADESFATVCEGGHLPGHIAGDDVRLWLVRRVRERMDAATASEIARHRQRGMSTERIAENLGYATGGCLRRR
jgi:hypothetical protein